MDRFPYEQYPPSYGAVIEANERVNEAQFGDGYAQWAGDGINTSIDKYRVTWTNAGPAMTSYVYSFLRSRLNRDAFLFRLPDDLGGELVQVRCKKVSKTFVNWRNYTISADLQQVHLLGGSL